jgi:SOS-response transcriptional repressor LexA
MHCVWILLYLKRRFGGIFILTKDSPPHDMTQNRIQQTMDTVYDYICRHIQEHGYPPSQREIAAACYLGKTTLVRYLDRLEMSGRITHDVGHARSIRIIDGKCPELLKKDQNAVQSVHNS